MTTTPKQEAHTATPLTVHFGTSAVYLRDANGLYITKSIYTDKEGVERMHSIAQAVNGHSALIAALEEIADMATQSLAAGAARRALELARTPTPGEKP